MDGKIRGEELKRRMTGQKRKMARTGKRLGEETTPTIQKTDPQNIQKLVDPQKANLVDLKRFVQKNGYENKNSRQIHQRNG